MMKKIRFISSVALLCCFASCTERSTYNPVLKEKLDLLYYKDQALRELYFTKLEDSEKRKILNEFNLDSTTYLDNMFAVLNTHDSLNMSQVKLIVDEFGYPGRSLVGDSTYKAAWYIIQHSNEIEAYLPVVKAAADNGELDMTQYAMMYDRWLMGLRKEQVYGTQGAQYIQGYVIWPIENPIEVNARRLEVGFKTSIEEYAQQLGFEYEPISIEEMREFLRSMGEEF